MPLNDELQRRIIRLALPALGTLAVEPIYILVDTAIVGRLGTPQLAGMAIASIVLMNVVSIINFLEYITPDIAYAVGAGRPRDAHEAAGHGVWLSVLIGVPAAVLVAATARPLCWLIGGRGDVLRYATQYLTISAIGLPAVVLAFLGHGVLRGHNDLRTPLRIVVIANVVNLLLEIITVYGFHWGVAGSASSTVVVQVGAAAAFVWRIRPHMVRVRPSWIAYRPLLAAGWHMVVRSVAMYSVWNVSVVIAARLDAPTLAAYQVVTQLFMFLALLLDSLAVPAHSLVAGYLGSGDREQAGRVGDISTRLALWSAGVLAVVLAVSAPWLPALFTNDHAVHTRLVGALVVLAVLQFPGAIAFALDGALIGADDKPWLARQAVRNIVAFVPLAIATVVWPRLGLAGIWGAQVCWMVMRAWANSHRWRSLVRGGFATTTTAVA